jgi:cyanophycinase
MTDAPPPESSRPGPLCLVGGAEWTDGCSFDRDLWEQAGRPEVTVLPTAAAYEHPGRAVETARRWFSTLGATVEGLMILSRSDALDERNASVLASARFIYLGGGSPMHLRSVFKDTPAWEALVAAWRSGGVLAGSSAGAMVLGDPMVDPRGGALTLGLGVVQGVAVLPHYDTWSEEKAHRTVQLATGHLRIAAIDERTALIRRPEGVWEVAGAGQVTVYVDGRPAPLSDLPT